MILFVVSVGVLCILVSLMLTLLIVWIKEDDLKTELKKIYLLLDHIKKVSKETNEVSKETLEKEVSKETLEKEKDPK